MKQSIEIQRAKRIFEEILDGDDPTYDKADFSDIIDLLNINRNSDDYAIETHMNYCFLKFGYKWVEMENDEMQLVKKKESK